MCNGNYPTDTGTRVHSDSGVSAMQRPWLLAKANGFIFIML
jgi:hypothetical protein